jgi:hypothetical protein
LARTSKITVHGKVSPISCQAAEMGNGVPRIKAGLKCVTSDDTVAKSILSGGSEWCTT